MKIAAYEVLDELGRGGMGAVYRVRGPDGREAALKVLVGTDRGRFARFERERRLLASLGESEGFVGLLDAGVSGEKAWLLMPLVPGGTLRQRLMAGPLGVEETIALGEALATALGRAHERGIVHRDMKPENVLFTAQGHPLLADLGLAKHFDRTGVGASQSVALTVSGEVKGTAGYMAPEQLERAASAGPPADVFSLGAVLHECLTGRPAFQGGSVLEVLSRLASGTVPPIGRPGVPAWLEAALARALATDPRARFATGAAFASALRRTVKAPPRRSPLAPLLLGGVLGAGVLAIFVLAPSAATPNKPLALPGKSQRPPPDKAVSSEAKALAARADAELARGDWDAAIADWSKAIELAPGDATFWVNRAGARAGKTDWDGAIADCSKAIELDPGLAMAWAERGYARLHKGDWDGSLADSTRAIELNPRFATAWTNRAEARQMKGDWDGEIADSTKALELNPTLARAWANRGYARGQTGDWDGSLADSTRAIELEPASAKSWLNRGAARGNKGDWNGALADMTKAVELEPTLAAAWTNRGIARLQRNDAAGIADLERSLELGLGGDDAVKVRQFIDDAKKRGLR
jgi:tetratricopeptide (TPR) repeat protein